MNTYILFVSDHPASDIVTGHIVVKRVFLQQKKNKQMLYLNQVKEILFFLECSNQ